MIRIYPMYCENDKYKYTDIYVETDAEKVFEKTKIIDCEAVRGAIKEIDRGEWISETKFRDRFGQVLDINKLSTGSKGCIVLACNHDLVLDGNELGSNALDCAIHIDTDAGLIIDSSSISFSPEFGENIHALAFDPLKEKFVEVDTVTRLNEEILAC